MRRNGAKQRVRQNGSKGGSGRLPQGAVGGLFMLGRMRLTPFVGSQKKSSADKARTTVPGFVNESGQEVIARTGRPSTSFRGQVIYRLKCRSCSGEYGSNGCDIHKRRCPVCQDGAKGEPLPVSGSTLFD